MRGREERWRGRVGGEGEVVWGSWVRGEPTHPTDALMDKGLGVVTVWRVVEEERGGEGEGGSGLEGEKVREGGVVRRGCGLERVG